MTRVRRGVFEGSVRVGVEGAFGETPKETTRTGPWTHRGLCVRDFLHPGRRPPRGRRGLTRTRDIVLREGRRGDRPGRDVVGCCHHCYCLHQGTRVRHTDRDKICTPGSSLGPRRRGGRPRVDPYFNHCKNMGRMSTLLTLPIPLTVLDHLPLQSRGTESLPFPTGVQCGAVNPHPLSRDLGGGRPPP